MQKKGGERSVDIKMAVSLAQQEKKYIARLSWRGRVKIKPTDTPLCCVCQSKGKKTDTRAGSRGHLI